MLGISRAGTIGSNGHPHERVTGGPPVGRDGQLSNRQRHGARAVLGFQRVLQGFDGSAPHPIARLGPEVGEGGRPTEFERNQVVELVLASGALRPYAAVRSRVIGSVTDVDGRLPCSRVVR